MIGSSFLIKCFFSVVMLGSSLPRTQAMNHVRKHVSWNHPNKAVLCLVKSYPL